MPATRTSVSCLSRLELHAERAPDHHVQLAREAAERPGSRTVGELSDFIRHADSRDRAAIEMLLVSRRFLRFSKRPNDLSTRISSRSKSRPPAHTRAIILFGMVMVQIFSNAQFGFDIEYQSALEKLAD